MSDNVQKIGTFVIDCSNQYTNILFTSNFIIVKCDNQNWIHLSSVCLHRMGLTFIAKVKCQYGEGS